MNERLEHIAVFVPGFAMGGVPRVMMTLAQSLTEHCPRVDFVVARADGPTRSILSNEVRVVDLAALRHRELPPGKVRTRTVMTSIPALARYLRRDRPQVLLSGGNYANFTAVVGRAVARVPTRVILSHHSDFERELAGKPFARWVARHVYPRADAIVAVSQGVARSLSLGARIPAARITTIYNPAVPKNLQALAQVPLDHPWFGEDQPPVILGAGRFHPQKDFPTLLRAFARIRRDRPARLIILGSGKKPEDADKLVALAGELGIDDDVEFPGFTDQPFAYMARAAVFVVSSAWEGLPTALIEAMACGCPVVSTDCPSGPAEILNGGEYGPLVPVGDADGLAAATLEVLDNPPDTSALRARADEFSADVATARYLDVLRDVVAENGGGLHRL
jgi:glycosyltransferase involved in cell wall biosynthesis